MPSSVLNVANAFIRKAQESGYAIDPLKLQKLIYIAHGWKLAFTGTPLIKENFEAWRYGPVVPELYREFKEFKAGPITRLADVPHTDLSPESEEVIDQVWEKYRHMSSIELSQMTHEPGSAWSQIYDTGIWSSSVIPDTLIQDEFLRRSRYQTTADC